MRIHSAFIISITLIIATCGASCDKAREYRIETQEQFDKYKEHSFQPGDQILFKRGAAFSGMFAPTGQGTPEAPIRIDTYGEGDRPVINAQGEREAGILLSNISYWEVSGLEITNPYKNQGPEERMKGKPLGDILAEKKLFGILVRLNGEEKVYRHIYIKNCYIHHVNDMVGEKDHGGIYIKIEDLENASVDDLRITGNRIFHVGGVGIANSSSCGKIEPTGPGMSDYSLHNLWTNVYVADNYVHTTGRNNIIGRVSKDAIYERNVVAKSSRAATGHAIFCFNTINMKIQYNEAYGNDGPGIDRGGFDADYNCVNTYIQYNYSHDNEWFCGIMRKQNRGVFIRYNVSQNEGKGFVHYGFRAATQAQGVHVYNNTYYVKAENHGEIIEGIKGGLRTTFTNNIFFIEGDGKGALGGTENEIEVVFNNNVYYNVPPHPTDNNPMTADPKFVDPGKVGTDIDLKTMEALSGYHLRENSPYLNGAIPIENNGGVNILGEPADPGRYGAL